MAARPAETTQPGRGRWLGRLRSAGDRGFTLIELLVVAVMIGVLAAIAISVFLSQRSKGWDAQAKSDVRNLATAEEGYLAGSGVYTSTVASLGNSFHQTNGVQVGVAANGSSGFCAAALSQTGTYWWYDSQNGGLQGSATTSAVAPNNTGSGGACVGQTVPVH